MAWINLRTAELDSEIYREFWMHVLGLCVQVSLGIKSTLWPFFFFFFYLKKNKEVFLTSYVWYCSFTVSLMTLTSGSHPNTTKDSIIIFHSL